MYVPDMYNIYMCRAYMYIMLYIKSSGATDTGQHPGEEKWSDMAPPVQCCVLESKPILISKIAFHIFILT